MAKITDLKKENIQLIRTCFYNGEIWTKNELSRSTGLSLAASTNILQYLLKEEEILFVGTADSTGGRKSKQYQLNPDYCEIGIISLELRNDTYIFFISLKNMLGEEKYRSSVSAERQDISAFDEAVNDLVSHGKALRVLCVSIPGVCANGIIGDCDYRDFANYSIGEHIVETWHLLYVVENDANSACIGMAHQYSSVKNLAVLYQPVKDGFGCGIIIGGKLYNGFSHAAGEIKYLAYELEKREEINAYELMQEMMRCVISVLNPEMIGYATSCFDEKEIVLKDIPKSHLPEIIHIDDFSWMIEFGLYSIGMSAFLNTYQP